ncbi:hypothetical protein FEM03_03955 [Phragmitibacter flavus]|uniref:Uncharacterized protein n=1 Tax=Phragmitibacter flavus TaxID=2576071 RepID=A0A5R8KJU9_9BACT|nr:hypothetical protein [Phragmitibacter flavus]TLD71889.1 hypothetical protein FEM03_03955 [Phragmitibacter flavus]
MNAFRTNISILYACVVLLHPASVLAEQDIPPQILVEAAKLWQRASPLRDGTDGSEREMREALDEWSRIDEIGEDTMSRALLIFYQQMAGVERFSLRMKSIPKTDPDFRHFAVTEDSKEKGEMLMLLIRDPRRTEELLPLVRKRVNWLIDNVPNDKPPAPLDTLEIGASAEYLLIHGTASDKRLIEKLRQRYDESPLPQATERIAALQNVEGNIEWLKGVLKRDPLPFVRRIMQPKQPSSAGLPSSDHESQTDQPVVHDSQSTSLLRPTLSSYPQSRDRGIPVELMVVAGIIALMLAAWFALKLRARRRPPPRP